VLTRNNKRQSGATIAETAAAMVLLIPLIFTVLFVTLEASKAYLIKESLSQGAREGARALAVAYGQNAGIQYDSVAQQNILGQIHINGVIHSADQFETPVFNSSGIPPTVSLTVNYASGQYGLPTFPNPDPLNLGANFKLSATSTYRLE
jgi:Flp pilus assembly protein TadG